MAEKADREEVQITEEEVRPKNIHEAMAAIYCRVGYVQKTKSAALNYSFAGEAALIEAIRPWMVEYGVYMYVKDISDITHEWYTTDKGRQMLNTTLKMVVSFVHAPSGTSIEVTAVGEGSDTGDKSINKASTGAFKYALRQSMMIATGDDPDKDSSDGMEKKAGTASVKTTTAVKPNGNGNGKVERTQKGLLTYAEGKGLDKIELGKALGTAGFKAVDLGRWDEMIAAVDGYRV